MPCDDCSRADDCPPCVNEEEPPGSAGSSPDECQHEEAVQIAGDRLRRPGRRIAYLCNECGEAWTITTPTEAECRSIRTRGEHCFEHGPFCCNCGHPAEPDAAQEAAMRELIDLRQEMEADEPEDDKSAPCKTCGEPWHKRHVCEPYAKEDWVCGDCGENVPAGQDWCAAPDCAEVARQRLAEEAPPPRRPPYAVAYAVAGGAQYEIALPGDATVRFADGALKIDHSAEVTHIIQVRPMGGNE